MFEFWRGWDRVGSGRHTVIKIADHSVCLDNKKRVHVYNTSLPGIEIVTLLIVDCLSLWLHAWLMAETGNNASFQTKSETNNMAFTMTVLVEINIPLTSASTQLGYHI